MLAGQAEEAIDCTNRALAINPKSVDALVKRGEGYCLLEKFPLALADCNKALSIRPDSFEAIYRKGCALCGLKRYVEALTCLDAAIRLRPERAVPHLYRGTVREELHQYEAALADFHEFQTKASSSSEVSSRPIAFMSAIKCERAMKRSDLEMAELNKWIALDSEAPDPRRLRGQLYQSQSRFADARKEYEAASKMDPSDQRSIQLLKDLQGNH